ncbi:TPA: hypothetical protein I8190_003151 [Citrobacter freundii]|uniref:hypothetical protein n=1 Tax=Citrobacter TaxID=544 RepID=UPI001A350B11|nr:MULTISPECIES: hypothetical protein [Citrobacter]ELR9638010.1 hypothetical protein [Citrobacter farmeri]HAT2286888.1 hypothetical protein [Citrobacter freundii]WIF76205.1 hypothetical protein QN090_20610 [Citrobacter braakii]HAT2350381.1 hypothetical protein [Citrobacter freundii]HAT2432471.1 hypothetical protein [Citrobacter freundii]
MTGSTNIDNIIISGVRIYFPPDNKLPSPSSDMLTFAVVRDDDMIKDYLLLVHRGGRWELASSSFYKEPAHAITAATKIIHNPARGLLPSDIQ